MTPPPERACSLLLDSILRAPSVRSRVSGIASRVAISLAAMPDAIMAWDTVPLGIYPGRLPADIKSSWVFILRARSVTGLERHPGSVQRMMSWKGSGDFQIESAGKLTSHLLTSDPSKPAGLRWVTIPPLTWHQGVVGRKDWTVVSFHTVPAEELIEERRSLGMTGKTIRKRYLSRDRS